MSDLCNRLRNLAVIAEKRSTEAVAVGYVLLRDAADDIEQLKEQVQAGTSVCQECDVYATQLTDVGHRLQQAVGSPGGMSLPEQIEHGLQAAIEQQAKIKRLREELQVALGRDEQWLAAALVVCHKEIEQLRAAKAAGGGDE